MAKRTTAISQLDTSDWQLIQDAVNEIRDKPSVRRRDFSFSNNSLTVLVYRAGTVIRVDFKEV